MPDGQIIPRKYFSGGAYPVKEVHIIDSATLSIEDAKEVHDFIMKNFQNSAMSSGYQEKNSKNSFKK